MANEKAFENRIKQFLKNERCWYVKYWGGGVYTKSGIPDILACIGGKFVGIEVKAESGKVAPLQLYNRDKIRESGGISLILYPSQFEEFKTMVYKLKNDSYTGNGKEFDR